MTTTSLWALPDSVCRPPAAGRPGDEDAGGDATTSRRTADTVAAAGRRRAGGRGGGSSTAAAARLAAYLVVGVALEVARRESLRRLEVARRRARARGRRRRDRCDAETRRVRSPAARSRPSLPTGEGVGEAAGGEHEGGDRQRPTRGHRRRWPAGAGGSPRRRSRRSTTRISASDCPASTRSAISRRTACAVGASLSPADWLRHCGQRIDAASALHAVLGCPGAAVVEDADGQGGDEGDEHRRVRHRADHPVCCSAATSSSSRNSWVTPPMSFFTTTPSGLTRYDSGTLITP